ncbi:MAG: (2Fe-2S)-binding protein [candidate division WOR-3 bacterium]|nr:MAG: (2Fe-2S)-binding protein [candidate division WOR-3 bacterium]
MMRITINGKKCTARYGETVLQVAQRSGIRIPTLCHHKDLSPYGGCRLCIVDMKGKQTPLTACTLTAEDGMVIKTDTPRLRKLRRSTLQLILSEHPSACLICEREKDCDNFQECIKKSAVTFGCKSCPQNNKCELQDLVRDMDIKDLHFEFRYRNLETQRDDPFFDRDYNLCVLCGRCIRACHEIRHAHTLEFHHRGPKTLVGTAFDLPHLESGCQFCGACVDICPTGALRDRFSRYDGPPERTVKTTCMLCSIGCAVDLNVSNGKITCSTPHKDQICARGRFAIAPIVNHPRRITKPLMKKRDGVIEVEWDEALECVSQKLREHRNRTGFLFSPQLTVEAAENIYALGGSLSAKLAMPFLSNVPPRPLALSEIKGKAAMIIVNTDMVGDYSVLLLTLRRKMKDRATFIVIDAFARPSDRFADTVLKPNPGTEQKIVDVLCGPGRFPKESGISAAEIELAQRLVKGKKVYVLYDPSNSVIEKSSKSCKTFPLFSQPNALRISRMGFHCTHEEMLTSKNIDCLYLVGVAPKLERKYGTVIVQDCFLPDFDFDVFLPAATFAETDGQMVDIEDRTKRVRRAIEPIGRAMPDDMIVEAIARAMDLRLTKKSGKRKIVTKRATLRKTNRAYPLRLIVRENAYTYRGKTLSAILRGFDRLRHDRSAWINENTAKKFGLRDGARATIIGRRTSFIMPVKISSYLPQSTVLVFDHPSARRLKNEPVRLECTKS